MEEGGEEVSGDPYQSLNTIALSLSRSLSLFSLLDELGHWAHNHVFRTLLVTQVHLFALFYLFSLFIHSSQLYSDFSFSTTQPILIGFLLFQYIYAPMEAIMSFFMNLLSRHHEFQADRYAKNLGYAKVLASGLIKLQVKNLGNMNPDWLYSMWHYSHPPLVEVF